MSRAALLLSIVAALTAAAPLLADTEVPTESSTSVCEHNANEHTDEEVGGDSGLSLKAVCKESDQNVLFQGRLQVLHPDKLNAPSELQQHDHSAAPDVELREPPVETLTKDPATSSTIDGTPPANPFDRTAVAPLPRSLELREAPYETLAMGFSPFPESPPRDAIEKMAMAPGDALDRMVKNAPIPRGWLLLPAIGSFFLLLMQCTDTHPDSYGMEEEEKDDPTRPPVRADRLQLFDMARFGLLVGIIWTQLMLAFGHSVFTSTLHEFVWPAWFFMAGIFGSNMAYESLTRVICYSVTTNCLLASIGTLLSLVNYHSQALPFSAFFGGAWVLWCLLLFRLTITPLFHISRALRVPPVLLVALIHFCSYASRLHMSPTDVVVDLHARQIEHLLLMVKTYNATIQSALLNAPYFAAGLLMTPTHWHSLLSSTWFVGIAAANGLVWVILTVTPLLCSLGHWQCPERPWGVKLLIHADNLSGFFEDAVCYVTRMSAVLVLLCILLAGASFLTSMAPNISSHLGACGSRIRYTITLFAIWYMIRPCILVTPKLPFYQSTGMNDITMGFPALFIALILTSSGTQQLFRWIVEPYWAKCCFEGCCSYVAEHFCQHRRSDKSALSSALIVSQQNLQNQHVPFLMAMQTATN